MHVRWSSLSGGTARELSGRSCWFYATLVHLRLLFSTILHWQVHVCVHVSCYVVMFLPTCAVSTVVANLSANKQHCFANMANVGFVVLAVLFLLRRFLGAWANRRGDVELSLTTWLCDADVCGCVWTAMLWWSLDH